jgi:all-trans-8'-apo-beta-carotenal 15,15'-oxygenase
VHPNKTGGRHPYVWLQSLSEPPQHPGAARFDCKTGEVESWAAPTAHLGSEPMFVPSGEREESGCVLQLFQDPAAERSYLAVLNAERLGDGPLAKIWFNEPVPMTFHGIFV